MYLWRNCAAQVSATPAFEIDQGPYFAASSEMSYGKSNPQEGKVQLSVENSLEQALDGRLDEPAFHGPG
jgi:hypothetical protein